MPLNGRNAALAEIKSSYGAHQKKMNEARRKPSELCYYLIRKHCYRSENRVMPL